MKLTRKIATITGGLLLLIISFTAHAQGPPIYTGTPVLLGLEGRGLRTFGRYVSKENTKVYIHPIALPYNFTPKFQAGVVAPFVSKSPANRETKSGLGDVSVFAKYVFWQKDGKGKTFRSLIKVQETFPTGKTGSRPPLGTGAYQTLVSLNAGFITTRYGLYGEIGYNFTSDNLPDDFLYNIALGMPLLQQQYPPKQLNIYLEFTGTYETRNNIHALFIAPGLQYIFGRRFLLESGIQLPLAEGVPEAQKTNFIYTLGTRILIF